MRMKKFVIYQTINPFNGHYYIGKSTASRIARGYKGSGNRLKEAFLRYGKENFITTVLWEFDTEAEAFAKERELVTPELVIDPRCYNLQEGGSGGTKGAKLLIRGDKIIRVMPEDVQQYLEAGYIPWRRSHSEETRQKMSQSHKGKPGTMKGKHHSEETKRKISEASKGRKHTPEWHQKVSTALKGHKYWGNPDALKGRTRSEESRAKQRATIAERGRVAWNKGKTGCYAGGTIWMNNGHTNRRVKLDDVEQLLQQGWLKGKVKQGIS